MAYYGRNHHLPHDYSYTSRTRDTDNYAHMRYNMKPGDHSSGYDARYSAAPPAPPPLPKRSSGLPDRAHYGRRRCSYPPRPSVEDEASSLAKEIPSPSSSSGEVGEHEDEAKLRGTVDQYPILQEVEPPSRVYDNPNDDRRFVLLSDPNSDSDAGTTLKDRRRRKSFAERGNIPHLNTNLDNAPELFPKRVSTPYAYTKPSRESTAPGDYFLSPEPLTPSASSVPRSTPSQNLWDRDQNAKPPRKTRPDRYDSFTQSSPRTPRHDTFEDSDADGDDNIHVGPERRPGRYSFVKSDLQKDDLRTSLRDSQTKPDNKSTRVPPRSTHESSSSSSKHSTPPAQSPWSSTSSLNGGYSRQKTHRPKPVETTYAERQHISRPGTPLRPDSPLHPERRDRPLPPSPPRSPKLGPSRPNSRPSSRGGVPRPASPLSHSHTFPTPTRAPVTEVDWHATYAPTSSHDRSRPSSRYGREETLPMPMPRIGVQSPSPARPVKQNNPLPYPVDDRPGDVFMPPEQAFQFDHSTSMPSPIPGTFKQPYPEPSKFSSSPTVGSPREHSFHQRPSFGSRPPTAEEIPRSPRVRSNSFRSQSSHDGRRYERKLSVERALPTCLRSEPSTKYNDWYSLENCPNFDLCPDCFDGVFADTKFDPYFKQTRRYDSRERSCDFSSPWIRLAWLLTIKEKRNNLDLLYALAQIDESEKPCPRDKAVSGPWYGLTDPRDGHFISNFAICPCDFKRIDVLMPSMRGYFSRMPVSSDSRNSLPQTCALKLGSVRFRKYLDLLFEIDAEAQSRGRAPNMEKFYQLARENAYKGECTKDVPNFRKPWHFIPALPEFTVCQECYDEVVWPAIHKGNKLAAAFNRTIQLVPAEDNEGTSCCLYSGRMRRIWARALDDADFVYLKRKAIERKKAESKLARERSILLGLLKGRGSGYGYGMAEVDKEGLRRELAGIEREWKDWE